MVRIRVKIIEHDGTNKKPVLVQTLCDAKILVNKIVESKESFFLITDKRVMDKILKDEVKQRFFLKGLEVQYHPEYDAERAVLVRNVNSTISVWSEMQIAEHISKEFKVKSVIKIPNSNLLLKIVFSDLSRADKAFQQGLRIHF